MPQQGRASAGDMTGRTKAAQQKEARLADQERAEEAIVAQSDQDYDDRVGVFDAQTGEQIDGPAEVLDRAPAFLHSEDESILTGQESPEEVAAVSRREVRRPPVSVTRDPFVIVRVDQDVDEMTYGMTANGSPNNYTFKEGRRYRIPVEVADHLSERNLVRSFG